MIGEPDYLRELYPFLFAGTSTSPGDSAALLVSVRNSTLAKCAEVIALRTELLEEWELQLELAAVAMAERFASGGKVLSFGNGGSATDADDAAIDCLSPPNLAWRSLPAVSLSSNSATVTALANDVGLENAFSRQILALGDRNDIAIGFSTSGNSHNIVSAFSAAKRRGMLTIACTGYDGGIVAAAGTVDFCFVARREFVPRIQEGHATLWHTLLELVQHASRTKVGGAS